MADIADVLDALAGSVASALYPDGALDAQGNALPSVAGPIVKVMRGTPFARQMDEDLRDGIVNVTVNERPGVGRTTTRFPMEWSTATIPSASLTTAIAPSTITLGGAVTAGQGIILIVDGQPYAYHCSVSDTLASVAAGLASLVMVDRIAVATAGALTIPGAQKIVARNVVSGTAVRPVRQQTAGLSIKVLAPTFSIRDMVGSAVDSALAIIARLLLSDGSVAMLRYSGTVYDDRPQKALTFIRTLLYQAEYSTTQTKSGTTIGVLDGLLSPFARGNLPGQVILFTDAGPPRQPLPSDLNVLMQDEHVLVDSYGNPEVQL